MMALLRWFALRALADDQVRAAVVAMVLETVRAAQPPPSGAAPKHRPISTNKAPGAI